MRGLYTRTTEGIRISVEPIYLPDESSPMKNEYVWAYHILIENLSHETITLRRRHWFIVDALGRTTEVVGEGVVGEEPRIHPGNQYEYTSATPLSTPSGIMVGSYLMEKPSGAFSTVHIPAFSLDSPYEKRVVH